MSIRAKKEDRLLTHKKLTCLDRNWLCSNKFVTFLDRLKDPITQPWKLLIYHFWTHRLIQKANFWRKKKFYMSFFQLVGGVLNATTDVNKSRNKLSKALCIQLFDWTDHTIGVRWVKSHCKCTHKRGNTEYQPLTLKRRFWRSSLGFRLTTGFRYTN